MRRLISVLSVSALVALAACTSDSDETGFAMVRDAGDDPAPQYTGPADINGCPIEPGTDCLGDLSDVDLSYANLSGARIFAMEGVTWRNVNLTGANLSGASIEGMEGSQWENVNLTGADLSGASIEGMEGSRWENVDLTGANLSNSVIRGPGTLAWEEGVNLTGVNFTGATLWCIWSGGVQMPNANLTNAQLREVDLYQANLDGTDFTGATLQGVSFDGASMEGATLNWASAEGTYLPDGQWAEGPRGGPEMDFCER